jgi:hypothetical protein
MKLNKLFIIYAELNDKDVVHEEYEIEIPVVNVSMAETAGKSLCESLGLKFLSVFEKDWK